MRKGMAAAIFAALALLPQRVWALEEVAPVRQAILGTERIAAYWVLGVCSTVFIALVCIWSIGLKREAKKKAQPVAPRVRR